MAKTRQPLLLVILFLSLGCLLFDVSYGDLCPRIKEPLVMDWKNITNPGGDPCVVGITVWALTEGNKERWLPFQLRLGKLVQALIEHFDDGEFAGTHYSVLFLATSDGHAYDYYGGWVLDRPRDPDFKRCLLGFGRP